VDFRLSPVDGIHDVSLDDDEEKDRNGPSHDWR